jgi:hypothetical protein
MGRVDGGKTASVLMAFVLGAVSGATVALMWAPDATAGRLDNESEGAHGAVGRQLERTLAFVQQALALPAREKLALLTGFGAGLACLRRWRSRGVGAGWRRIEGEEPLFIG